MKNLILIFAIVLLVSCGTKKAVSKNLLFEILTQQKDGGANIQFYEILSEVAEITRCEFAVLIQENADIVDSPSVNVPITLVEFESFKLG